MEELIIFIKWKKHNGFIFVYVMIVITIILTLFTMLFSINNYIKENNRRKTEEMQYKYILETYTCFLACHADCANNEGKGYVSWNQYYYYKVEKKEDYFIIYGKYTHYQGVVYFQKFNSHYTIPKTNYIIYEEGYIYE